jgi:uncharacterized protein YecE (DUF72 family)
VANVQAWRREKKFVYTVKVCELITHVKKFKGTKTPTKDFGMIADVLGDRMGRMGCCLVPPACVPEFGDVAPRGRAIQELRNRD